MLGLQVGNLQPQVDQNLGLMAGLLIGKELIGIGKDLIGNEINS